MRRLIQLSFVIATITMLPLHAWGDTETNAEKLIRQLGSESFQSRIDAERQLLDLGIESFEAVTNGTQSDNPEIRTRSQRVLIHIQEAAIAASYEKILEDPWTVPEALAPGWETFFSLLGDGQASRQLYVELLKAEQSIMLIVNQPNWQDEFERLCSEVNTFSRFRYRTRTSVESMIALLMLACHPDNEPTGQATSVIYYFLSDPKFRIQVKDPVTGPVVTSLVAQWISKSHAASANQRLSIAMSYELDAGLEAARELIQFRRQRNQSSHLKNAIFFLAKYGSLEVVDELEELLDDETTIQNGFKGRPDVQVRDLALIGLLHLTEQDPRRYLFPQIRSRTRYLYNASSARFDSKEARTLAFERWRKWRVDNLKKSLPVPVKAVEGTQL